MLRALSVSSCLMNRPLNKSQCNCTHYILWQCGKDHAFWQDTNKLKLHAWRNQKHLTTGNACYHSVKNLLSTCLLSKNNKIKIHRTTTCLLFHKRVTPASLTLRKENSLRVLRRVLREVFEVRGRSGRRLEKTALCVQDWYCLLMNCHENGGQDRCIQGLVRKLVGKGPHARPQCSLEDNIKMYLTEGMDYTNVAQDSDK